MLLTRGTGSLPRCNFPLPKDFDEDGTLSRKDLEKLVNCLTGQGEEVSLSNAEMEQLIENVRTIRLGRGRCVVLATQSSLLFSLPCRSWRSQTLTRTAPSTSPSSSTSSPAPRTLSGTVACSGAVPGGSLWG